MIMIQILGGGGGCHKGGVWRKYSLDLDEKYGGGREYS